MPTRVAGLVRTGLIISSTAALAATLASCGPDDGDLAGLGPAASAQWPTSSFGFAGNDYPGALAPYPDAQPMTYAAYSPGYDGPAPYARDYGYAPDYYDSYGDDYYRTEPAWYESDPAPDNYGMLALAATLGAVLANSPPDYGFGYGGTQPWVWRTGDRYMRYAEPLRSGYRYYYYAPGADYPFLVRDPYYSYGYRDSRLVVIYDRDGRAMDPRRAWRQRSIGDRYFARSRLLLRAGGDARHFGVAAPLWAHHAPAIRDAQRSWDRARAMRPAWQAWDRRHDPVVTARWAQERAVRQYSGQRFAQWRAASYKGPAPRFYREAEQDKHLGQAVRDEQSRLYQRAKRQQQLTARERWQAPSFFGNHAVNEQKRQQQAIARQAAQQRQQIGQARFQQARFDDHRQANLRQAAQQRQQQKQQQAIRANRQHADAQHRQLARQQQVRAEQARAGARQQQQARAHQAQLKQAEARQAQARQTQARQTQARQAQARQAQARQKQQQATAHQKQAREQAQARQQQARQQQARQQQARQQQARRQADARRQQAASRQRQAEQRQAQARKQQQAQQRQAQQRQAQQRQAQQRQAQQRQPARQQQARSRSAQQRQADTNRHGRGHG